MKVPRGIKICAALVIIGAVLCAIGVLRINAVGAHIDDYPTVAAGGSGEVHLEPGSQVGFFESTCFGCDAKDISAPAPSLRITDSSGSTVAVDTYGGDGTAAATYSSDGFFFDYSHGDFEGEPVYSFDSPASGTYRAAVGPSSEPDAQMRLGPGVVTRGLIGIGLVAAGAVIAAATVLTAIAWGISVLLLQATRNG